MDQQYPTVAKIPVLDTGKLEQWQFWIQQYLQHEHYALWEVIEFGDSYVVPASPSSTTTTYTISGESGKKSGRTVTLTAKDMQKKKNDVKARTTLLLSLPDEHQLQFSKYKTARTLRCNSENIRWFMSQKYKRNRIRIPRTWPLSLQQNTADEMKMDINQIDEDDMEEMDIKWNMALLSMRADKFWKKINIQGSDVAGFDKSKAPKALMAIDRVGWDWSYMANDEEDHALVADEVAPTEFALMANTSAESKKLETLKEEKERVDGKLAGLLTALKDLDNLIKSQRSDKNKDGLGYSVVPPPPAQLYLSPKKDLSWTGLPECADDTVTDYSRPSPTVESTSGDDQNRNPSVSETVASPITPKPFIKFVKPKDS
nr:hypothetical protein [Tanacetum cinerariifolium]